MTQELLEYTYHLFAARHTKLSLDMNEADSKEEKAFLFQEIAKNQRMRNELGKDHTKYLTMN
jgi:hypothetical protein